MIESLGTFSSRIDAWMVAEGIERAEEMAALQRLRVPLAQGYWLGMPAPAMEPVADDPARRRSATAPRARSPTRASPRSSSAPPAAALAGGRRGDRAGVRRQPGLEHVTVLDGGKRPVAIVPRQGFFGGGARERTPMRVELARERDGRRAPGDDAPVRRTLRPGGVLRPSRPLRRGREGRAADRWAGRSAWNSKRIKENPNEVVLMWGRRARTARPSSPATPRRTCSPRSPTTPAATTA